MNIESKMQNGSLRVHLSGEMDDSSCDLVKAKFDALLDRRNYASVVVDLSQVSFMDSSGIGLLVGRFKKLRLHNIPMMICNPNATVDKVFKVSGIYQIMPRIS